MKIVIISQWFSENMGYTENLLPKALARLGPEVHLVTSDAQIYFNSSNYGDIYEPFIGPRVVKCQVKKMHGYTLHRLPHYKTGKWSAPGIVGLQEYLKKLNPDIIQVLNIDTPSSFKAARFASEYNIPLFSECHVHASVLYKKNRWGFRKIRLRGRLKKYFSPELKLLNKIVKTCYPIAPDAAKIANKFYGVSKNKIKSQSLGVDTDLFHPPSLLEAENVKQFRRKLDFSESDIVCIYTGRFTSKKNPHCLAKAIDYLSKMGEPYKGLFIGNGEKEDIEFMKSMKNCTIHPFVKTDQLPKFYWVSDIGVWPREESLSQLDAVSCGLPIIINDSVEALERVQGNGLFYKKDDYLDLSKKLLGLKNKKRRLSMGKNGTNKISKKYSWTSIAKERLLDYQAELNNIKL